MEADERLLILRTASALLAIPIQAFSQYFYSTLSNLYSLNEHRLSTNDRERNIRNKPPKIGDKTRKQPGKPFVQTSKRASWSTPLANAG